MNLLFDYGGVLVRLNKQRCLDAFDALGFDIRPYLGVYAQRGVFSELERGKISVGQFCDALRRLSGRPDLTDAQLTATWATYLDGIPAERLDLLLKISRHYPTYLLSNVSPIHWALGRDGYFEYKGHHVGDFFRKTFLSYELGYEKPAPEIYAAVVKGIGCTPSDILFFDDSETNCEAARRCGLQARLAPADGSWMAGFTPDGLLRD